MGKAVSESLAFDPRPPQFVMQWYTEALVRKTALCYMLRAATIAATSLPPCAPLDPPALTGRK